MSNTEKLNFATLAIHGGQKPDPITGAIAPVLVRSKTFKQPVFGSEGKWQYARGQNPTRDILEEKLSALEGDGQAAVYGSGIAAEAMFFLTLNPGDEVILCKEVYGGTHRLFKQLLERFGIVAKYVDFSKKENVIKEISKKTKYLFVELLTNPSLEVNDLRIVSQISKETGIPYVADLTFTPPCAIKAFEYGAETIIHSLSKYISGHNDVIGGAVITKNKELYEKLKILQRTVGAILSPDECYRVIQGAKTLQLRWKKCSENAILFAEYLSRKKEVVRVLYPGLESHKDYKIVNEILKDGVGGVLSFELKHFELEKVKKFVDKLQENDVIFYGESLAAPETILAYPKMMSHRALNEEEQLKHGINSWFFRLAVGLENVDDIINCFESAFKELS